MKRLVAVLFAITISGCANEESGTLSCPGPGETGCDSLDTVYQSSTGGKADANLASEPIRMRLTLGDSEPNLTKPKVVRVWLSPWQDDEGDLHDQQYLYLIIEPSHWDVDHMKKPLRETP